VTKGFTALAVMKLRDEGRLSLDVPAVIANRNRWGNVHDSQINGKAKGSRVARRRRAPVRSAGHAASFFFATSSLHKAQVAQPPEGNPAARSDPFPSFRACRNVTLGG
jgi:hypothetical protein